MDNHHIKYVSSHLMLNGIQLKQSQRLQSWWKLTNSYNTTLPFEKFYVSF